MHHYPFHVGDYIRATAHLDIVEDCIYRRLIDLYMETELPIPNETQQVIRRLRLGSSGLILETILKEFFTLEADNCWHNSRCDREISEYKRLADVSRINGKLGGRPKKTQRVILDNPAGTQQEPVGLQPRTKNQEPITNIKSKPLSEYPTDFELAWAAYPARTGANKKDAFKAWSARIKGGVKPSLMIEGATRYAIYCKAQSTEQQYIKQPSTFFGVAEHYLSDWKPSPTSRRGAPQPENFADKDYGTGVNPL